MQFHNPTAAKVAINVPKNHAALRDAALAAGAAASRRPGSASNSPLGADGRPAGMPPPGLGGSCDGIAAVAGGGGGAVTSSGTPLAPPPARKPHPVGIGRPGVARRGPGAYSRLGPTGGRAAYYPAPLGPVGDPTGGGGASQLERPRENGVAAMHHAAAAVLTAQGAGASSAAGIASGVGGDVQGGPPGAAVGPQLAAGGAANGTVFFDAYGRSRAPFAGAPLAAGPGGHPGHPHTTACAGVPDGGGMAGLDNTLAATVSPMTPSTATAHLSSTLGLAGFGGGFHPFEMGPAAVQAAAAPAPSRGAAAAPVPPPRRPAAQPATAVSRPSTPLTGGPSPAVTVPDGTSTPCGPGVRRLRPPPVLRLHELEGSGAAEGLSAAAPGGAAEAQLSDDGPSSLQTVGDAASGEHPPGEARPGGWSDGAAASVSPTSSAAARDGHERVAVAAAAAAAGVVGGYKRYLTAALPEAVPPLSFVAAASGDSDGTYAGVDGVLGSATGSGNPSSLGSGGSSALVRGWGTAPSAAAALGAAAGCGGGGGLGSTGALYPAGGAGAGTFRLLTPRGGAAPLASPLPLGGGICGGGVAGSAGWPSLSAIGGGGTPLSAVGPGVSPFDAGCFGSLPSEPYGSESLMSPSFGSAFGGGGSFNLPSPREAGLLPLNSPLASVLGRRSFGTLDLPPGGDRPDKFYRSNS